jgi:predicted CoA-binding protein
MIRPDILLKESKTLAVLGVNQDFDSYANKIVRKIRQIGKIAYPVNPKYTTLFDETVYASLNDLPTKPDVVVFVVNPNLGLTYLQTIKDLGTKYIWLQPGTISQDLLDKAEAMGLIAIEACVLVVSNYL